MHTSPCARPKTFLKKGIDKFISVCYNESVKGDDTHKKKRRFTDANQYKGETPIEKNVIVVDAQGNEYEATYPKRAKGLVKNGRARFIGENKICLACPPKQYLEETKMDANNEKTTNSTPKLTVEEVFAKMAELQAQLTENSYNSMHRLTDSVESICGSSMGEEEMRESLNDVTTVFLSRETSYREMIGFYREILDRISVKPKRRSK